MMNAHVKKSFSIMLLLLLTAGAKAQHDGDLYNQITSMEFSNWEHTPEPDFHSWYKKKIDLGLFSIYISVPGKGWHDEGWGGTGVNIEPNTWAGLAGYPSLIFNPDGYIDESWRLQSPIRTLSVVETNIQNNKVEETNDYWQDIFKRDAITVADRMGVADATLNIGSDGITENDRQAAYDLINKYLPYIPDSELKEYFLLTYYMLQDQIYTIRKAHIADARRTVQLTSANIDLEELAEEMKTKIIIDKLSLIIKGGGEDEDDVSDFDRYKDMFKKGNDALSIVRSIINLNKLD